MPKWKHVLSDDEFDRKERRGPHIKSRTPKKVKFKDRGLGKPKDGKKLTPLNTKIAGKYKGHDTANGRSICNECGEPITFTTNYNGQLIAMEIMCMKPHRHQPPASSPAENRARIEEMRKRES